MKNPPECEGCSVYGVAPDCFAADIEGCPCKSCLVKVTCLKPCENLGEHLNKAKAAQKERRKQGV